MDLSRYSALDEPDEDLGLMMLIVIPISILIAIALWAIWLAQDAMRWLAQKFR